MEAGEMDIDLLIVDLGMTVFVFGVFCGQKKYGWCFGSEYCSAFKYWLFTTMSMMPNPRAGMEVSSSSRMMWEGCSYGV